MYVESSRPNVPYASPHEFPPKNKILRLNVLKSTPPSLTLKPAEFRGFRVIPAQLAGQQ